MSRFATLSFADDEVNRPITPEEAAAMAAEFKDEKEETVDMDAELRELQELEKKRQALLDKLKSAKNTKANEIKKNIADVEKELNVLEKEIQDLHNRKTKKIEERTKLELKLKAVEEDFEFRTADKPARPQVREAPVAKSYASATGKPIEAQVVIQKPALKREFMELDMWYNEDKGTTIKVPTVPKHIIDALTMGDNKTVLDYLTAVEATPKTVFVYKMGEDSNMLMIRLSGTNIEHAFVTSPDYQTPSGHRCVACRHAPIECVRMQLKNKFKCTFAHPVTLPELNMIIKQLVNEKQLEPNTTVCDLVKDYLAPFSVLRNDFVVSFSKDAMFYESPNGFFPVDKKDSGAEIKLARYFMLLDIMVDLSRYITMERLKSI
jgi:hypothetical protein